MEKMYRPTSKTFLTMSVGKMHRLSPGPDLDKGGPRLFDQ